MTIAGSPIKMTETMPSPGGRAPLLDEHRTELLDEAGVDTGTNRVESDD
jgi:succinyl-CoA:mesaconate CoA transferase